MRFINRDSELRALESKFSEKRAHLFILYGKRRVGKTELIKQFIKNKPAIYFLADRRSFREQLRELTGVMARYFNDASLEQKGFRDWIEVFRYLAEKAKGERLIFAVDEYPYLVETDEATSSLFQKGWDEYLKESQIFLILSGSSISMMESEALLYKAPLYGRRSGQILLKPLSFKESWQFFPDRDFETFLGIFTVTGGMPAYLQEFSPEATLEDNLRLKIFPKDAFLHNEIEFTLKEELREPKNYLSILKAMAGGRRKFGEITNETGLAKNILMKYLTTLERLQLIEKEIPVTEKTPEKSRKGLYQISDPFFKFWFQYIFPYKSDLEIERYDEVMRKWRESFHLLMASTYERVCQELMGSWREAIFPFERVGRWWERENEIDLVALAQERKEILFGECKWSEKPLGTNIFAALKKKAGLVQWERGRRKNHFILFSRSGFTEDMIQLARKEGVFLVEKNRLLTAGAL